MGRDFNKSSVPPCSHWQQQAFKNVNGASFQSQWWALLAKIPRIKVLVSIFLVFWEAFQKSKGGNKLCSIRGKTSQAYCAENKQQTMSPKYTWNNYEVLKQKDQEPGNRMSDFMKPILSTERHRLFTFFMQGCFQWKIRLFSSPPRLYPSNLSRSPLFYFSWSFLLCYTCACTWNTQSSAGIWVSHTEKGNPIIVSRCVWNEWICTVSSGLDSKADISMTSTQSLSSQPAQRQGDDIPQDIWEPRALPRHHHCSCCLWTEMEQREYLSFTGFTQRDTLHTIRSALQAEKQANNTNWESCKTYRTQKKSFPSSVSALGEA